MLVSCCSAFTIYIVLFSYDLGVIPVQFRYDLVVFQLLYCIRVLNIGHRLQYYLGKCSLDCRHMNSRKHSFAFGEYILYMYIPLIFKLLYIAILLDKFIWPHFLMLVYIVPDKYKQCIYSC